MEKKYAHVFFIGVFAITFVSVFFFPYLNHSNSVELTCLMCELSLEHFFPVHFNGRRFDVNASVNDHIDSGRLEYK